MKKFSLILTLMVIGYVAYHFGSDLPKEKPLGKVSLPKKEAFRAVAPELPELKDIMPSAEELDEVTQKIVGFDPSLNFWQRNNLVWELKNRKLTKKDFEAFFAFLSRNPEGEGSQLSWHSLKNDLLVLLIDDGRYKESMAKLMNDIINDEQQHSVMREYVLQYTTDYFERHWLDKFSGKPITKYSEIDKFQQAEMIKTMIDALKWPEGPIAGTALIRLHEISQTFKIVDDLKINAETKRMVIDPTTSESSRMAAISIAVERNLDGLEQEILQMAFNETESPMLRISALNALTIMTEDENISERISREILNDKNCDKRVLNAAQLSIKKLTKKKG